MSDLEFTRESVARWMWEDVPHSINYWIAKGELTDVDEVPTLTVLEEFERDNPPTAVTFPQFMEAIDTWATANKGHKYRYYAKFSADWLGEVWERVDYDAEVVDQIFQTAAFGKPIYG